ncbi:MAG: DUF3800 domain-containing protein [Parcubacteria group bacterium]|nr:DUF3800 domain-containing protein [Parcubacteria group bacterium]
MADKKKIYAYVDESGQDTKGLVFVVSVLIMERERENLADKLENIEKASGKNNLKWHKARRECRQEYIKGISRLDILRNKIFFEIFSDTKKYLELTAYVTAKAILKKSGGDYKATVFVDGLRKKELAIFIKGLRDLKIKTKKVRGVKKDENNVFIRLVDAVCGLIRDSREEKNNWAKKAVDELIKNKISEEL